MGRNAKPVDVTTAGPLFAQAARGFSIGALPLADGYSAKLTVLGSESVTVPAGTFDAFKVESKPADGAPGGQTLWIDKATR